jgi:hypothetical protein
MHCVNDVAFMDTDWHMGSKSQSVRHILKINSSSYFFRLWASERPVSLQAPHTNSSLQHNKVHSHLLILYHKDETMLSGEQDKMEGV